MAEPITISFVGTTDLKALLEQWAAEDERSVSYVVRKILQAEAQRRKIKREPAKPQIAR